MGSLKRAFFLWALAVTAWAGPHPGPPPLASLGPVPTDKALIEAWVQRWPQWREERQRLRAGLERLRARLRDQGEAEARRGQAPRWWNLPQRQQQTARLRYLQRLRVDYEEGQVRLFQARAVEAQWIADLEQRQGKRRLVPPLRPILDELHQWAEKDLKDKGESD